MPIFSKRHYQAIADIVRLSNDRTNLFISFSKLFEDDNYNFNKAEFARACGLVEYAKRLEGKGIYQALCQNIKENSK